MSLRPYCVGGLFLQTGISYAIYFSKFNFQYSKEKIIQSSIIMLFLKTLKCKNGVLEHQVKM